MTRLLFLGIFLCNVFWWQNPWIGAVLLVSFFLSAGTSIGRFMEKNEQGILYVWFGIFILLSIVSIIGSLAYYLFSILAELSIVLVFLTIAWQLAHKKEHPSFFSRFHDLWHESKHSVPRAVWIATSLALFFLVQVILILNSHPITDAVRSLFERTDVSVLIAIGLSIILTFTLLFRGHERAISLPLFSLLLFTALSIALFSFPIGYGFDSFIHQATERYLAAHGTIDPKPFYYIGQYALVLFVHHGFFIPLDLVDRFLLPVLAALLLPIAWYAAAAHVTSSKTVASATLMGIFLLPLSSFIVTTPQGLANLWILLLILASVPRLLERENAPKWIGLLLAVIATFLIHPLAGIPALFFLSLLFLHSQKHRMVFWIAFVCASFAIPFSFVMFSLLKHQPLQIDFSALNPTTLVSHMHLGLFFENRFSPLLDFVYLYSYNSFIVFLVIALTGFFLYRKNFSDRIRVAGFMVIALAVNGLLVSHVIRFPFLIPSEQENYGARLVPLILFFLVPFVLFALGHLFLNLQRRPIALKAGVLMLLSTLAIANVYLTYPRRDAYETSHGFNVSQSDLEAVQMIDEWAKGEPYLVLANQSVSAAAMKKFGFRYYDDLFFYPIPTGGKLYALFLRMNDRPARETAREALDLVPMHGDVQTLFYAVNTYWFESSRIIETAKTTANEWKNVRDGTIYLFRYDF